MTPWISLILLLPACAETLIPEAEPLPQDSPQQTLNVQVPGPTVDSPPPMEASFNLEGATTIQLSGTATYAGETSGTVLLQFLREEDGEPAKLLHSQELQSLGSFLVDAPANLGAISVVAILDRDSDGAPTLEDLGGRYDVEVGAQSIESIRIEIGDITSLGSLTPGQPMPGTGTIDGPMVQLEAHEATVEPPPEESMGGTPLSTGNHPPLGGVEPPPAEEPNGPTAPNVPRALDTPTVGTTPATDHPPVGGVEPPPTEEPNGATAPNVQRGLGTPTVGDTPATAPEGGQGSPHHHGEPQ